MTALFYSPSLYTGQPGSKLTFTQTATTTPQNTYQEETLVTPHANPVVADTAGVFPPIYLDPTLPSYRVKWTTAAGVLLKQWDGVPSNQNIQQSIRLVSTNPFLFLYDTDGAADARKYRIRAAGNAFEVALVNDAESVFTPIISFTGGVLFSASTEVAVTSSGTFTGTLTGMTTTVTGTINYRKVNNIITLWIESSLGGTSNSTGMTMTGLPAAIQPSVGKEICCPNLEDNSNFALMGQALIVTSTITFLIAKTNLIANYIQASASGFTNSGGKGLFGGWSITYPLS